MHPTHNRQSTGSSPVGPTNSREIVMHTVISNNKRKARKHGMKQDHQSDKLKFQKKKLNDQTKEIEDQSKRIEEFIKQQRDKSHNQE